MISVVIPVFNRLEPLQRAVESVFSQTVGVECVVVDDASTVDLSPVRRWLEQRGGRWIQAPFNGGPARARNLGAGAASGQWLAFLDSDDWWQPDKVERQRAWHEQHPDCRVSQVREIWMRNGVRVHQPAHWEPGEGDLFDRAVERCAIGPSCVMIRRDLWEELGGFDPRYRVCEDYELWLRLCRAHSVGLVPGPPLVEKSGGHPDQLSTLYPALDAWRVVALLECLWRQSLSSEQRAAVIDGIRRKSQVLAKGAAKRGYRERAGFYEQLALHDDWSGAGVAGWVEGAWAQVPVVPEVR